MSSHPESIPAVRANVKRLIPYMPGEQPQNQETIKLNTNENPYPPSDNVMKAIAGVSGIALRRYPDATSRPFREMAAKRNGVTPEQIIATNGGDELLRMLITAYCEPSVHYGKSSGGIGVTDPTYSLYPILANIHDAAIHEVKRTACFDLDPNLAEKWNDAGCRLGFIVNPHAPTGRLESVETLREVANQFNGLLLVDEAYVDFAEHDCLALIKESLPNVILLRSLSKGYGLAGLRFGYGIGSPEVIETLHKVRDSYNCDAISQAAAEAALADQTYYQDVWEKVKAERTRLSEALSERGFSVLPSHTNFILCQVQRGSEEEAIEAAKAIYSQLKERHIFIRYFNLDRLRDRLRISIGTPEENDRLLVALDEMTSQGI